MSTPGTPEKSAPSGAIFLGPDELAGMLGDFGVRRALELMLTGGGEPMAGMQREELGLLVDGIIRAAFAAPPPSE